MTCIVGIEHAGVVWIGGDSAAVCGMGINTRYDEKVFINDTLLIGFTDSFRMGQLLRYGFDVPEHSPKKDDWEYLIIDVMDVIRDLFKDRGWLGKDEDRESGGDWLMGYKGKLYTVFSDFQVGRSRDGYAACGCGEDIALGSLHTTANIINSQGQVDQSLIRSPQERITMALGASSHHSAGVRPPFTILSL